MDRIDTPQPERYRSIVRTLGKDGAMTEKLEENPTPGFPNDLEGRAAYKASRRRQGPDGIRFSEICPTGKSEFIELYNAASEGIDISGYGLSDKEAKNMPVITFDQTTYDFGEVIEGERLTYAFKFKNTGKSNLIIYSSEATCGCTTSQPPKAPVRPGESGEITVTFDSKGQKGKVQKRILVGANTYPAETILTITANVTSNK